MIRKHNAPGWKVYLTYVPPKFLCFLSQTEHLIFLHCGHLKYIVSQVILSDLAKLFISYFPLVTLFSTGLQVSNNFCTKFYSRQIRPFFTLHFCLNNIWTLFWYEFSFPNSKSEPKGTASSWFTSIKVINQTKNKHKRYNVNIICMIYTLSVESSARIKTCMNELLA